MMLGFPFWDGWPYPHMSLNMIPRLEEPMDFLVDPMVDHRFLHPNMPISWCFVAFRWLLIDFQWGTRHATHMTPMNHHEPARIILCPQTQRQFWAPPPAADYKAWAELSCWRLCASVRFSGTFPKITTLTMESDWRVCEQVLPMKCWMTTMRCEVIAGLSDMLHLGRGLTSNSSETRFRLPSQNVSRFATH